MFRVSERFACRVVGQHRSTQRHAGKVVDIEEIKLRHRLREIAAEHIRWGRRMACGLLRREGWTVNQNGFNDSGVRKACRGPLHGNASGHDPPMAPCGVTRPNTRIRCGRWTSSSMPPLMAGG